MKVYLAVVSLFSVLGLASAFAPHTAAPVGAAKSAVATENSFSGTGVTTETIRPFGLAVPSFRKNRSSGILFMAGDDAVSSGAKIIIAGAPASGKGTQCEVIKEKFGVVHLSTGDMLRAAVAAGTEVGKMAKDFMDSGKLVPDEVIIGIVSER
jgi:adenylate kinase